MNDNGLNNGGMAGDKNKSLEYQTQALNITEKELGPDHPDTAASLNKIGLTYRELGDHNKALVCQERAFNILNKIVEPEHPTLLKLLDHYMSACIRVKKFTQAYSVLNAYLKKLPEDHPEYAYLVSFKSQINKEGTQTGFRPPSAQNRKKKRNKKKK